MELPFAEAWKIKMVEPIKKSTREQREKWLKEAHNNVFMLKSDYVYIDLLTDSGTGAMSDRQWAAMMQGDESYGGARSFYHMKDTITEFDTTKGHIESRKAFAIDVTVKEAYDTQLEVPFKGNVDLEKLEKILKENKGNVPFMVLTVTNNTVGGQPVSMQNIRETCELCHKYGVPVNVDSARFIENAYFIKTREKGYENKTLREIALEMFSYADSMTMSAKKDGLVNMGGFIATNKKDWYEGAKLFCIPFEGFLTYGGMNGRDMDALAVGLKENIEFEMVETRIKQVQYLADKLDEYGIPYQRPAGGHAIFVDGDKVLTNIPKEEFPAQTLTCELYLEAGIRACEIGYVLADRDPVTRENRFGGNDFVRLCIPRRVYTNNHMDVIAAALKNVYDRRDTIKRGLEITWEAELMRHFTCQFKRLG